MNYLKIKNWDKWQSYRSDRSQPPWIKIHRQLMRNLEWVALNDAQRGQLISIWLLAADKNGEVPNDPKIIKKLCHMDKEPDLNFFIDQGFIEHDANVTSERRQPDANVTHQTRLDKTRLDKKRLPDGNHDAKDFLKSLKENNAYKHINIDSELGKMDAWLSAHPGRQKNKKFVVNWLNKIEPPLPKSVPPRVEDVRPAIMDMEMTPEQQEANIKRVKELTKTFCKGD